jgi:thiazole synthase
MYGSWVKGVERLAREASLGTKKKMGGRGGGVVDKYTGEGAKYLWDLLDHNNNVDEYSTTLEPWETGFHSTGGFLAPAFAGDAVATWSPQPQSGAAHWLDEIQVRELEPKLHPNVIGGWWFPEDASVDARRLTCSLRAACIGAGVHLNFGDEYEVKSLEMGSTTKKSSSSSSLSSMDGKQKCIGVHCAGGQVYAPQSIIVANGSWMRHLLPLPVTPHKGQSFSLRMPPGVPPLLSRVLFAQDTYIVPKADGRIIVGATVEPGRYDGDVTPEGMMHCLSEAMRLVPGLGSLPIEESWAGLRPTTPDKCPIIGKSGQWSNVYLAGGYWRNGVLLAPKTGQLVGDLVVNNGDISSMTNEDRVLLDAFAWERFTRPGGGAVIAAQARYAATFYPVHKRSTDGVSTSVGTELGFYEGAAAAKGDRARDRNAMMFGISDEEEQALERAAGQGKVDAGAFSFGETGDNGWMVRRDDNTAKSDEKGRSEEEVFITAVEADPDAFTASVVQDVDAEYNASLSPSSSAYGVGSTAEATAEANRRARINNRKKTSDIDESKIGAMTMPAQPSKLLTPTNGDLSSIYETIKSNKARAQKDIVMGESDDVPRPKLDFTIYHVDSKTREEREVPQYTSLGEFLSSIEKEKAANPEVVNGFRKHTRIITDKQGTAHDDGLEHINGAATTMTGMTGVTEASDGMMDDASDEKTFDGYQAIQEANSSTSREEELRKMKEARMKNRAKSSGDTGDSSWL